MKTLTLNDRLYAALEEESNRTGRSMSELAAEAVESWLSDTELGEAERVDIEASERERCDFEKLFRHLSEEWRRDRPRGADVAQLVMQPAYQRIIGMGEDTIPLILSELERRPDHWFWALHSITGADPISDHSQGNLSKMTGDWLEWGREMGYCW